MIRTMKALPLLRAVLAAAVLALTTAGSVTEARIYKYQRDDGTWVFTDDASQLPRDAQRMDGEINAPAQGPAGDLAEQLRARFQPRNEIENAALSTVVVQSSIGRGSGFFVSESGHILTNRHVVRTPERKKRLMQQRSEQVDLEIEQYEKRFEREQQRLDALKGELESFKGRLHPRSYTRKSEEFSLYQEDLDRRKAAFYREVEQVRDRIDEEAYKNRIANIERYFTVVLADKTELRARLVAVSEKLDLALLKIDGHRTPYLTPGKPYAVPTGGRVYAIGNPIALQNSVAEGILSGYEGGYIKTDAKIYPGNSGGPLVSKSGEVLGINTFKRLTRKYEGLGFAIPVHAALREFAGQLNEGP
jgi:S1-C subfamily serine protease